MFGEPAKSYQEKKIFIILRDRESPSKKGNLSESYTMKFGKSEKPRTQVSNLFLQKHKSFYWKFSIEEFLFALRDCWLSFSVVRRAHLQGNFKLKGSLSSKIDRITEKLQLLPFN